MVPDEVGRHWRERAKVLLADKGIEFCDPYDIHPGEWKNYPPLNHDHTRIIFECKQFIDRCDCVLAKVDDSNLRAGTAMEVMCAYIDRTPVVGWTETDLEHVSPWFAYHCVHVYSTLETACDGVLACLRTINVKLRRP